MLHRAKQAQRQVKLMMKHAPRVGQLQKGMYLKYIEYKKYEDLITDEKFFTTPKKTLNKFYHSASF